MAERVCCDGERIGRRFGLGVAGLRAARWSLINQYAADHGQAIAGGIPILALDMYEHAYHIDFGANAKAYIDAFMRNVDWKAVQGRYEDASKVEPLRPLVQEEFADVPGVSRKRSRRCSTPANRFRSSIRGHDIPFLVRRTSWTGSVA